MVERVEENPKTLRLVAEFHILGLPQMTNSIGRSHWSKKFKEARKWKSLVFTHCLKAKITQLELNRAVLTLTRHSTKEPDFDGLVSGFKHVIDGLVEAKVIISDKPSVLEGTTYRWEKRKAGGVTIRIQA